MHWIGTAVDGWQAWERLCFSSTWSDPETERGHSLPLGRPSRPSGEQGLAGFRSIQVPPR